jgi:integrase
MAERITDALVRKAEPAEAGLRFIWDTLVKGFALRVTVRGAKSFVLDYRIRGRQRRITIGSYPEWSVAAAREAAKDMKREVDLGGDPMGERHADRTAPTVQDLWRQYEADYLPRKAERTQADERSMWRNLILLALGKMKVVDVTHEEVQALHRQITDKRGTPVRANRTVEVLRKAFNLAIRWKWRPDNPATGIQRNQEEKRTRYLSQQELARLSKALAEHHERVSADAIRFLMLTGARRGEVLNARWDMFDLGAGIWTKPSAHTKQRREHRVPLSAPARALLAGLKRSTEGDFVFPGKAPDQPLSDIKKTWASVCRKARVEGARIHDLRHSFASILVSQGASLPLIGALLGHTQVATTARYAHLYDEPLREAAELVGSAIDQWEEDGSETVGVA